MRLFGRGEKKSGTGRTVAEEYRQANAPDGEIIFDTSAPIMPDGGVAVLKGNLCPDGAVINGRAGGCAARSP